MSGRCPEAIYVTHYYSEQPDSPSQERVIDYTFNGLPFQFTSDKGVFSKNHVDEGSKFLLESMREHLQGFQNLDINRYRKLANGACLDLGCGYGVLGIVSKRLWPGQSWTFSDVNERALALTERNAHSNGIFHPVIVRSHGWDELSGAYDVIVTNPPIRIGKEQVYDMFRGSAAHLLPGGILYVVIGKKQGAESAGRFLASLFADVKLLGKDKGFFVYACQEPQESAE